jgi:hypothetical protein
MNEVTGTGAAFATTALILRFGNNYSFFITPPFLALAGIAWFFVDLDFVKAEGHMFEKQPTYIRVCSPLTFLKIGHSIIVIVICIINLERSESSLHSKKINLVMGRLFNRPLRPSVPPSINRTNSDKIR